MKRLPAFTLLESLLALLLTGVVGAMAMLVVQYLHGEGRGFQVRKADEEVLWLLTSLGSDALAATRPVVHDGDRLTFVLPADTVHYEVIDSTMVRHSTSGEHHVFHVNASNSITAWNLSGSADHGWTVERSGGQWGAIRFDRSVSLAEQINALSDHADIPATPR